MILFDFDRWTEIYQTLSRHKLRTFLTALGVFWGIFMLVILMGVGTGFEKGSLQSLSGYGVNSFILWPTKTSIPYMGLPAGRKITFTNHDFEQIKRTVPGIETIAARNRYDDELIVTHNSRSGSFILFGDFPEYRTLKDIKLAEGRFINANDIQGFRKMAVIGNRVKEILFPNMSPIGRQIQINQMVFKVVGCTKANESNGMGDKDDQQTIYIPHTTYQQCFNQVNRIDHFAVSVQNGHTSSSVIEDMERITFKAHNISPDDDQALEFWSAEETFLRFKNLFHSIRIFIWVIGIGSLLAGIIGVSNIMLIVVKERTKEIGIRKALGATPLSVITLILQEAVLITTVSGIFGIAAGIGLIELVAQLMQSRNIHNNFFSDPEIRPDVIISSLIILIFSGCFAGFFPAKKAAIVNPIVALKDE